jgi:hypothetical protein
MMCHNRNVWAFRMNFFPGGGTPAPPVPDAVLHLPHQVQASKEIASAIMIDVKGAFDHFPQTGIIEEMALSSAAVC